MYRLKVKNIILEKIFFEHQYKEESVEDLLGIWNLSHASYVANFFEVKPLQKLILDCMLQHNFDKKWDCESLTYATQMINSENSMSKDEKD